MKKAKISLIVFLIFSTNLILAQWQWQSKIIDAETKRPVPFANVAFYINGFIGGTSTNLDGQFEVNLKSKPDSIVVSCVGYQKLTIKQYNQNHYSLQENEKRFSDVLILPGENPALRIIRNCINNREKNDIEFDKTFSYEAYTIFNADIEPIDSTKIAGIEDTTTLKMLDFFRNKQAFVSETFSHFHYKPKNNRKEEIIAAKTSGMKNPLFSLFANQIQPFSAYKNPIELFATEYLNPLTNSGMKGYFYILQDTNYLDKDTIFIVDFRPKLKSSFSGSHGTVYINSNDWSVNKIIFNFPNPFGMALGQENEKSTLSLGNEVTTDNFATIIINYEKLKENWVPIEVRTIYPMGKLRTDMPLNIYNTSYFSAYKFGVESRVLKTNGAPIRLSDDASLVDDETWKIIRGARASSRIDSTYYFMDSLSQDGRLDRLTALMLAATEGKIKISFLDLDINKTLNFNDFEGFRLGLGLETNERFLKFLRIGGFFGYGFRDKTWKYGGHLRWILLPLTQLQAKTAYQFDVSPTGIYNFSDPTGRIEQGELIRSAYIRQMDYVESYAFDLGSYLYKSLHLKLSTTSKRVRTGYEYSFQLPESTLSGTEFSLFETGAELNWRIKDRYIQMGSSRLYLNEQRFPIIQLQYVKGWDNVLNGEYNYERIMLRVSQQFRWMRLGQLSIRADYQKSIGNVPLPMLIYTPGIYNRRLGVGASNIFETIFPNEFLNDELLSGFLRFNFNPWILKKGKFEPVVSLRLNAGIGRLRNPERHSIIEFSTMEKGFYEAGIVLDRLVNAGIAGYGFGVFYRFGAYRSNNELENLAFKLTLGIGK